MERPSSKNEPSSKKRKRCKVLQLPARRDNATSPPLGRLTLGNGSSSADLRSSRAGEPISVGDVILKMSELFSTPLGKPGKRARAKGAEAKEEVVSRIAWEGFKEPLVVPKSGKLRLQARWLGGWR